MLEPSAYPSNLKQLGAAMQMYLGDSADVMPTVAQMPSLGLNDDPRLVDVLEPHTGDTRVFRCPADSKYHESEGASYEFNGMLCGRKVADTFLSRRWGEENVPVMYDYRPFHGKPGTPGAANYLFADGHAGDLRGR